MKLNLTKKQEDYVSNQIKLKDLRAEIDKGWDSPDSTYC